MSLWSLLLTLAGKKEPEPVKVVTDTRYIILPEGGHKQPVYCLQEAHSARSGYVDKHYTLNVHDALAWKGSNFNRHVSVIDGYIHDDYVIIAYPAMKHKLSKDIPTEKDYHD